LFGREKVVPFDVYRRKRRESVRSESQVRPNVRAAQASLGFPPPPAAGSAVAAYGDAGAASPSLRLRAAAVDAVLSIAAIGIFASTFHFMGGRFSFGPALPGWVAAAALLGLTYHLFFALLGRNTAGAALYGLAVVNFDGLEPGAGLRVRRLAVALLSTAALGMGLIWALFDEERLTWHDQITKSFPTKMRK
jgi:uncharacterized RDD family membrane protein YckC